MAVSHKTEGTFYSVDTKINQSDWFRKLNVFSLTILTGYNLEVTMHVNYSLPHQSLNILIKVNEYSCFEV